MIELELWADGTWAVTEDGVPVATTLSEEDARSAYAKLKYGGRRDPRMKPDSFNGEPSPHLLGRS